MSNITEQERELLLEAAKSGNTRYSFFLALAIILIYALLFFTNAGGTIAIELLPIIVFIAGIIVCNYRFRKQMQGTAQFGELFSNGFKTVAMVILFIILWNVIAAYAFPAFKANEIALTRQTYITSATPPEAVAEIEASLKELEMTRVFILAKIKSILTFQFFLGILMTVLSAMFLRARNS